MQINMILLVSNKLAGGMRPLEYKWKNRMNGDVGMGCTMRKNRGNKVIPLSILARILAQSCVALCLSREGLRMIVLVSLLVLLRGLPCFHDFFPWCIPSLHPH